MSRISGCAAARLGRRRGSSRNTLEGGRQVGPAGLEQPKPDDPGGLWRQRRPEGVGRLTQAVCLDRFGSLPTRIVTRIASLGCAISRAPTTIRTTTRSPRWGATAHGATGTVSAVGQVGPPWASGQLMAGSSGPMRRSGGPALAGLIQPCGRRCVPKAVPMPARIDGLLHGRVRRSLRGRRAAPHATRASTGDGRSPGIPHHRPRDGRRHTTWARQNGGCWWRSSLYRWWSRSP